MQEQRAASIHRKGDLEPSTTPDVFLPFAVAKKRTLTVGSHAVRKMESEVHAQPKLDLPGMIGFSRAKVSIVTAHVAEVRRVVEGHRRRVHRRVVQQIGELKDKSGAHAAFPPQT